MNISKKSRKSIFWLLFEFCLNNKILFIGTIFFVALWFFTGILFHAIIGGIVNVLPNANSTNIQDLVLPKFLSFILLWCIGTGAFWLCGFCYKHLAGNLLKLREIMFINIQNKNYEFFLQNSESELAKAIDIMSNNLLPILDFICFNFPRIIILCITLMSFILINKLFLLSTLCWLFVHFFIIFINLSKVSSLSYYETETSKKFTGFVVNSFKNQKIKELFNLHNIENSYCQNFQEKDQKAYIDNESLKINIRTFQSIVSILFQGIFFYSIVFLLFIKGIISIGVFVTLVGINTTISNHVWCLSHDLPKFLYNIEKCKSVLKFLDNEDMFVKHNQNLEIKEPKGRIIIKNLCFSYENEIIIKNFSLEIEAGSKILVMGYSGIGKTTFINILSGILCNYDGKILFDDTDIRYIDRNYIKKYMTFITNYGIFDGTIKYNIVFDREIEEKNLKFIKDKILGDIDINDTISSSFCKLSDGEQQKLFLARGLINNEAKILIGDEIFKGLDFEIKKKLLIDLDEFMKNKTVIIVDHSLILAEKVDYIIFFGKNQKIYIDSYQNLSVKNEEYREFIKFELK